MQTRIFTGKIKMEELSNILHIPLTTILSPKTVPYFLFENCNIHNVLNTISHHFLDLSYLQFRKIVHNFI